jgi:cell division protein ZapE
MLLADYRAAVEAGELRADPAQEQAILKLQGLAQALSAQTRHWLFRKPAPRGLYLWGDVGRGKTLLMDFFFAAVTIVKKRRAHFNGFMVDVHARIHAERQTQGSSDPIPVVARAIARDARLLCFDEFQVTDVADAMILGRLFDHLFGEGVTIVATSNTSPDRLYEGGLNRQLFLPFIAEIKQRLDVVELGGITDYRLQRMSGLNVYITPLGPEADAAMDAAWLRLTDCSRAKPASLNVLGRSLVVPQAHRGVARFDFQDLCVQPRAAVDFLAVAQQFHTLLLDHIPLLTPEMANAARRFVLLIDTLYDEGVKLICSAAAQPQELYPQGDGQDAFRRTASRLAEMQSEDYLRKGHGIRALSPARHQEHVPDGSRDEGPSAKERTKSGEV